MNLLKALVTVSGMTLLSRILGFVRDFVIARVFGAGMLTDAFFVAFKLPNLLRRLFAEGAFSQAFVPILGEYKNKRGEDEARRLVDRVATLLFLVLVLVTLLGMAGAPLLVYLSAPGFAADAAPVYTTTGFARNALMGAAPAVIEQVKAGNIKHFFLVGGCDGDKKERSYYADFVKAAPKDTVILTLACGKFRFNTEELGEINGIPRYLDIGQCNDAYSAIQLALALADAFGCGVNDLPLTLVLSWYEQKAVCILLTLLYLGLQHIYLGPTIPAFVSPNVLQFLVENYHLTPTSDPKTDLKAILHE